MTLLKIHGPRLAVDVRFSGDLDLFLICQGKDFFDVYREEAEEGNMLANICNYSQFSSSL